jgi:hypothetical protein
MQASTLRISRRLIEDSKCRCGLIPNSSSRSTQSRSNQSKATIQLAVRKKVGKISGRVQDAGDTGAPIPNAKLNLEGLPGTTDSGGHFEFLNSGRSFEAANGD